MVTGFLWAIKSINYILFRKYALIFFKNEDVGVILRLCW
jgi:hypothetical protein